MMVEGFLKLHDRKFGLSYSMFYKGRSVNITNELNISLMDNVEVTVADYYGKTLFNSQGKLMLVPQGARLRPSTKEWHKNKHSEKYIYNYMVGLENLTEVLWNNVNNKLTITIRRNEVCEDDEDGYGEK